jgi:2-polyprenyl-3-methyl-5-hydroxy-6-metoxy-1,4-benzoquinol methylase
MSENRPYSKPAMKTIVRELTPPIVWRALQRAIVNPVNGEAGSERQSEFYDAIYSQTDDYHCHYTQSRYYFLWCVLLDRMQPEGVRCLVDVGCGPGQLASFLRDRGLRKYVGVDFSSEGIRMARSACSSFQFVCADVFTSDLFNDLEYDVVVATEFLEHVEGDLVILDRIRPGTRVYGSVPNFPGPSHVRHFNSIEDVRTRYSSSFTSFRVDKFLFGSEGMSFFLFEGVRAE